MPAKKRYIVQRIHELDALAREMALSVRGGEYLLLTGDLGSGKTTFTQYLLAALGVEEQVTSPSFQLMTEYQVNNAPGIQRIVHIDLYRLPKKDIAREHFLTDVFMRPDAATLTIIEWADRLSIKPKGTYWNITFVHGAHERERKITVEKMNTKGVQ